jgi:hypothetical protein
VYHIFDVVGNGLELLRQSRLGRLGVGKSILEVDDGRAALGMARWGEDMTEQAC